MRHGGAAAGLQAVHRQQLFTARIQPFDAVHDVVAVQFHAVRIIHGEDRLRDVDQIVLLDGRRRRDHLSRRCVAMGAEVRPRTVEHRRDCVGQNLARAVRLRGDAALIEQEGAGYQSFRNTVAHFDVFHVPWRLAFADQPHVQREIPCVLFHAAFAGEQQFPAFLHEAVQFVAHARIETALVGQDDEFIAVEGHGLVDDGMRYLRFHQHLACSEYGAFMAAVEHFHRAEHRHFRLRLRAVQPRFALFDVFIRLADDAVRLHVHLARRMELVARAGQTAQTDDLRTFVAQRDGILETAELAP